MSSPTSTIEFDFPDMEPSRTASSQPPSPAPTFNSRHYMRDDAVFKVANQLFHINRTLLDEETDMIPRGEDPIELIAQRHQTGRFRDFVGLLNIRVCSTTSLLVLPIERYEFSTRHDKKPFTVVDWASIITVSSIYGMQRVLNVACKSVMDQQKTFFDQQNAQSNDSCPGAGFERDTYGMCFLIKEKGTDNYLGSYWYRRSEGVQLQLWPRENGSADVKESQVFFINRSGALRHAASGLAVDIIDDVPVLRCNHPASGRPNPWSHPLAEFSFVNSQIRVKFLSDPSLPSCSDDLYPKDSWATKNFVLASRPEKDFHLHPISDFSPWIPATVAGSFKHETEANHNKEWRVLVEERTGDVGGARTSWEIIAASKS